MASTQSRQLNGMDRDELLDYVKSVRSDPVHAAGYQRAEYIVHVKARRATPEQIAELRESLTTSPAGDTFERHVPVTFDLTTS
jgi:hypothetical protein